MRRRSTGRSARCSSTRRITTSCAPRASPTSPPGIEMTRPGFRVETVDLDLPELAGALSTRLREAGLPVTPERAAGFARALAIVRPVGRTRLYWTARAVFVSDPAQVGAFDAVFFSVFGGAVHAASPVDDPASSAAAAGDERPPGRRREGEGRQEPEPVLGWSSPTQVVAGDDLPP